jgi:hypothetical protein
MTFSSIFIWSFGPHHLDDDLFICFHSEFWSSSA